MDTTRHSSPDGPSVAHSRGILLLRRTFAGVFIPLGAIGLAFAAGAALGPSPHKRGMNSTQPEFPFSEGDVLD